MPDCTPQHLPGHSETLRHAFCRLWAGARPLAGWCCLIVGLALLVLPGPGSALILAGLALLGRRHPVLRKLRVVLRHQCRRWARQRDARRWIGAHGLRLARRLGAAHTNDRS